MIGIGSSLFHTFATGWAQMADVLPILFFQIAFIACYPLRVMPQDRAKLRAALLALLFLGTSVAAGMLPQHWLNGSVSYLPAWLFLLGLGIYHWRTKQNEPHLLLMAAALFTVSLTARSLDMAVCDTLPVGLHYFWHMLNACVLYLVTRTLIVTDRRG